jgi:hypothetical protein
MATRISSLLVPALLGLGCARSVPMGSAGLDWVRSDQEIAVVYRVSASPWVDCPGNFGVDTWKKEAELWESVQAQRTESLRTAPPVDPAQATADRFLLLSRATPGLPVFGERPLAAESVEPGALSRRFGPKPILVLEATRWVLVGCFYLYQPWYNVRATLLETASGRVLWRDACGGLYPPDASAESSPAELEADGKALYSRAMEARAGQCASELLARLEQGVRAAGGH